MSFPSVLSAYIAIVIISVVVIALLLVVVATVAAVLPEPHLLLTLILFSPFRQGRRTNGGRPPHLVEGRAVRRKVATRPVADGGRLNNNE